MILNLVVLTWCLLCCRDIQNFISYHNWSISTPSSRDCKYHIVWTKGELLVAEIATQCKVTSEVLIYILLVNTEVVSLLKLGFTNNICAYSDLSQAMKVENMLKIKEEFDYKSLAKRLEMEIDKLIAENERQQKVHKNEIERIRLEAQKRVAEAEMSYVEALEVYLLHISIIVNKIYLIRAQFMLEGYCWCYIDY